MTTDFHVHPQLKIPPMSHNIRITAKLDRRISILTLALLLVAVACSPKSDSAADSTSAARAATPAASTAASSGDVTVTNATNFHMLDFVAWNNHDVDMFRRIHAPDVKVDFAGAKTDGIDTHVKALEGMWGPGSQITNHAPIIAEGEWTCMVGTSAPPANMRMVTVAKWRDGRISEEYLLASMLKPGASRPAVSGSPVVNISNQNAQMKAQVGAELGWSCRLERTADGKMVISVGKTGGAAADQMVFVQ